MIGRNTIGVALSCSLIHGALSAPPQAAAADRKTVRIGMADSLFRDISDKDAKASTGPFQDLVKSETGLKGEVVRAGDAFALARDLSSGKVQLGVFHGYELAWIQAKYPKLRALVIAVNQDQRVHASLMVAKNSRARDLAALKGKSLTIPEKTQAYCWLFLERACDKEGQKITRFFSKVASPDNVEDALDDVVDGLLEAALVDSVSLDRYKGRKPARLAKLKELVKSPDFPAIVVVHHEGGLDEPTLRRFKAGMLNANDKAYGRQLLTLWRLTGFEKVPADYDEHLKTIAKSYPAPAMEKSATED